MCNCFFFLERYYWLYIAEYFFNATVDALYMPVFVYDFLDIQQHWLYVAENGIKSSLLNLQVFIN